jgi:hypothetical protein
MTLGGAFGVFLYFVSSGYIDIGERIYNLRCAATYFKNEPSGKKLIILQGPLCK